MGSKIRHINVGPLPMEQFRNDAFHLDTNAQICRTQTITTLTPAETL
jgi:hypothetical protein